MPSSRHAAGIATATATAFLCVGLASSLASGRAAWKSIAVTTPDQRVLCVVSGPPRGPDMVVETVRCGVRAARPGRSECRPGYELKDSKGFKPFRWCTAIPRAAHVLKTGSTWVLGGAGDPVRVGLRAGARGELVATLPNGHGIRLSSARTRTF